MNGEVNIVNNKHQNRDTTGKFIKGNRAAVKSGAYSKRLPLGIRRKAAVIWERLVQDLGPTEKDLTTAQLILIDRIVAKLGIVRCIEEHINKKAVMSGSRLSPSLRESYLAYNNSIRLDLSALGIDKRQGEDFDMMKYVNDKYGDKAGSSKSDSKARPQRKP